MSLRLFKSCVLSLMLFATLCLQAGCAVLTVADAAVSVGATVVKTGVNAVVTPVTHTTIVIPSGQTSDRCLAWLTVGCGGDTVVRGQ